MQLRILKYNELILYNHCIRYQYYIFVILKKESVYEKCNN